MEENNVKGLPAMNESNKNMNSYNNKFIRILNKHYILMTLVVLLRQTADIVQTVDAN